MDGVVRAGVCQLQSGGDCGNVREGRYGGRAERGINEALRREMVTSSCGPRVARFRYPGEVSGPADEDICLLGGNRWVVVAAGCKSCYLGL